MSKIKVTGEISLPGRISPDINKFFKPNNPNGKMQNILIVGWNQESLNLFDRIKEYPALGFKVKGFITLKVNFQPAAYHDVPLLGGIDSIAAHIRPLKIDKILIAITPDEHNKLSELISICSQIRIAYQIVTDVYDTYYGHVIQEVYHDLFTREKESNVRRFIDFFLAIILMILLFPLFVVVSFCIKVESRGPIFYSQIRSGKNGRPFRIYKFRSMVQNAEVQSGPIWAKKNDPRITKFGKVMRLTRIDELPQLMNILKGDMSFIGPRPERPFFVETFNDQIPLYTNRLLLKPGVTGWAQVKWRYDETLEDVKEKLQYDLYYLNNHSLWLDIKIFFLTVKTILAQEGQ